MADASPSSDPRRITHLVRAIGGDGEEHRAALAELMPLVYDNLRHMARRQLGRERRSYTLESAALVNEAFLKLAGEDALALQNRAHFFAVSANVCVTFSSTTPGPGTRASAAGDRRRCRSRITRPR